MAIAIGYHFYNNKSVSLPKQVIIEFDLINNLYGLDYTPNTISFVQNPDNIIDIVQTYLNSYGDKVRNIKLHAPEYNIILTMSDGTVIEEVFNNPTDIYNHICQYIPDYLKANVRNILILITYQELTN